MENPGIDPGTSHMRSERSTIWANSPATINPLPFIYIYDFSKCVTKARNNLECLNVTYFPPNLPMPQNGVKIIIIQHTIVIFGWKSKCHFPCYTCIISEKNISKSIMENPGIDPGTSHMQSERSTIWANPPVHKLHILSCLTKKLTFSYLYAPQSVYYKPLWHQLSTFLCQSKWSILELW